MWSPGDTLQEAHVGLGIMGKEGRAAVRAADFAFAKFRFVKKVLLVHGHWFYYRVALLVHYFFYKNVACFAAQLFYCFYNNFSIMTLYDSLNLTFYNITWTSAPIFVFALLEQNLDKKTLMGNPVFYRRIRNNRMLRRREFILWFLYSLWHAVVVFFGWVGASSVTPIFSRSSSGAVASSQPTSVTGSSLARSASVSASTPLWWSSSTSSSGSRCFYIQFQ